MKKFISITLSLLLIFYATFIPNFSNNANAVVSDVVTFQDPELEAAVRIAINKPDGDIILSDVQNITMLNANARNISNISGIEKLTNLTYLNLEDNKISNISSLSGLPNLNCLILSKNNISDLSPLSDMITLIQLDVSHNQLTDISCLNKLTNLAGLNISFNQINNISSLYNLSSLTSLIAEYNNIVDITPLSELIGLQNLFLSHNQIVVISSLSKLTNLIQLTLGFNNQITDITVINNFPKLIYLDICSIQVSDISFLNKLHSLQGFSANQTGITNISVLSNLTSLNTLALGGNKITDINGLSNLTNLTSLNLSGNQINSIDALYKLTNLQQLFLSSCNISKIDVIENFKSLNRLHLYINQITDIKALGNLTNLNYLYMQDNKITDISPLNTDVNLKELTIGNNPIYDYTTIENIYDNLLFKDFSLRKLTSISINGADNIIIPSTGVETSQYIAISEDQYGIQMENLPVFWSVYDDTNNPVGTINIDSNGILSVTSTAEPGSYTIKAVSNFSPAIYCTKEIILNAAPPLPVAASIEINGSDTIYLPPSLVSTSSYTASIKDQYGNLMDTQTVTWSLPEIGIPGVSIDKDTGYVTINHAIFNSTFTMKVTLKTDNSVFGTKIISIAREPERPTQVTIEGQNTINIPKSMPNLWVRPNFSATVSSQWSPIMNNEQVGWSICAPVPEGISLTDSNGMSVSIDIDFAKISDCTFTLQAVSKTDPTIKSTRTVSIIKEQALAALLTGFTWAQGSATGTTKATNVPGGTLKYIVGSANTQVQPNVGDTAAAYTSVLTANADIAVSAGQHIFIVQLDNNGKIVGWADIPVDSSKINTISESVPPPVFFPPVASQVPLPQKPTPENGSLTVVPDVENKVVTAKIELDDFKALLDSAKEINGIKNLSIIIDNDSNTSFVTQLPVTALTNTTLDATTTINTPIANVVVPSNMFDKSSFEKDSSQIGITISSVDKSNLSSKVTKIVGDSPIIEISATVDGIVKAWSNPNTPVKISMPYTLKDGENSDNITVFYIDSKGKLENMQGVYNAKTKMVEFYTTHFSNYFIKENNPSFIDLSGFEGYAKYIENMASKGIIEGVGSDKYAPGNVLTRAEFATLLVKMLKIKTADSNNVFKDVNQNDWFAPYVNAAYKVGLISGIGEDLFAPNEVITNQDAAIILIKALKYKGFETTSESLANVKDINKISDYAKDSVSFAVSEGIISLDENSNFNSQGTVNRAEAAKYIYNIFYFEN